MSAYRDAPSEIVIDGKRLTVGELETLFFETHPIAAEAHVERIEIDKCASCAGSGRTAEGDDICTDCFKED